MYDRVKVTRLATWWVGGKRDDVVAEMAAIKPSEAARITAAILARAPIRSAEEFVESLEAHGY
jgi:hypothetical protein